MLEHKYVVPVQELYRARAQVRAKAKKLKTSHARTKEHTFNNYLRLSRKITTVHFISVFKGFLAMLFLLHVHVLLISN